MAGKATAPRSIYLIGASGAGKDSLIGYAREKLPTHSPVVFAHRYITRPRDAGGEDHIPLSDAESELRRRLAKRAREDMAEVQARIARAALLDRALHHPALKRIENNADLAAAGDRFLALLATRG